MRRSHRPRTIMIALALAITGALPTGSVSAAQPTTGTVTGVVSRNGNPIRGASVVVQVLPSLDDVASAPANVPIEYPIVANVQTDAGGRFTLVPASIAAESINQSGFANLIATVSDGLKRIRWFFPLKVQNLGGPQSARQMAVNLAFELGADPGVADAANPPSAWADLSSDRITSSGLLAVEAEPVALSSRTGLADITPDFACSMTFTNNWQYGVNEAFANAWAWTGGKATFHESQTTSHTLGISFQNIFGVWSQSGTASMQETETNFGDTSGLVDRQINNRVNYREQINSCGGRWWVPVSTYALQTPILYYSQSSHPMWPGCASYVNGQIIGKTTGTNTTFGAGVGLTPLKVSAQAGWSSVISIKWTFTANSWLCGSTAQGVGPSPQAESHQR